MVLSVQKQILFTLGKYTHPVTLDELLQVIESERSTIRARLSEMTRKGLVKKTEKVENGLSACYSLPDNDQQEEQ